jgi:hypothetical protein
VLRVGGDLVGQADHRQHLGGALLRLVLGLLLHQRQRERDVPLDVEMREEVVALEHHADVAAQLGAGGTARLADGWPHTVIEPPCTVSSPAMQRSSVLLPEPLRADDRHVLAARDVEADAVEHRAAPERLDHRPRRGG